MVLNYIQLAMQKAVYEILKDDNTYYGEIGGFQGVYANAATLEECRTELQEVLEEWILVRLRRNMDVPVLNGIDLNLKQVA